MDQGLDLGPRKTTELYIKNIPKERNKGLLGVNSEVAISYCTGSRNTGCVQGMEAWFLRAN